LLALGFHFTAWFVLSFLTVSAKSQRFVNAIIEVTRDLHKLKGLSVFALLWCNQKAKSIFFFQFFVFCCFIIWFACNMRPTINPGRW